MKHVLIVLLLLTATSHAITAQTIAFKNIVSALKPGDLPSEDDLKATFLLRQYSTTIELADYILDKRPRDETALTAKALCYAMVNDHGAVLKVANTLYLSDDAAGIFLATLTFNLSKRISQPDALFYIREAHKLNPVSPVIYLLEASVMLDYNMNEPAKTAVLTASTLANTDNGFKLLRRRPANVLPIAGTQGRAFDVMDRFMQAQAEDPLIVPPGYVTLLRNRKYAEALTVLNRLVRRKPDNTKPDNSKLEAGKPSTDRGLNISGYVDAYGGYYTDSIALGRFQQFPTYAPRSNQIGLNIAQLTAAFETGNVRSTITLHYGDIPASSWSPDFQIIQEANAGIRLNKKIWLDAGFFRTHIGAEGLYPKENITSSIATPTYYEPYYEAGFKLSYQITPKFQARLYLLNGYNVFVDNNRKKSLGMMATYAFNDSTSIIYANYIGDDGPDSSTNSHTRFYNNACLYYAKGRWRVTLGIDMAIQQNSGGALADQTASMFSGLLAIRYQLATRYDVYAREEYLEDKSGFLTGTYIDADNKPVGLKTTGTTLGIEYKPMEHAYVRLERRVLATDHSLPLFYWNGEYTNQRYETIFSMGFWF